MQITKLLQQVKMGRVNLIPLQNTNKQKSFNLVPPHNTCLFLSPLSYRHTHTHTDLHNLKPADEIQDLWLLELYGLNK